MQRYSIWAVLVLVTFLFCGCGGSKSASKVASSEHDQVKGMSYEKGSVKALAPTTSTLKLQERISKSGLLRVAWKLSFNDLKVKSLVVTPPESKINAILILTEKNDLIALKRETGEGMWWLKLGGKPTAGPAFTAYSIFFVVDGYLLCVENYTGNVMWRKLLSFPAAESIAATEAEEGEPLIAIASLTKVIHGLTVNATVWPPKRGYRSITRDDIAVTNHNLHTVWTYPVHGQIEGQMILKDGDLTSTDTSGRIYALDTTNVNQKKPALRWQGITQGPNMAGTEISGAYLFTGSRDRNIYAYERRGGGKMWRYQSGQRLTSPPTVIRDASTGRRYLFQSCDEGPLLCLTAAKGELVWQDDEGGYIAMVDEDLNRIISERTMVASVRPDASIVCRQAETGNEMWSVPAGIFSKVAANTYDDAVYGMVDEGRTLCKIRLR